MWCFNKHESDVKIIINAQSDYLQKDLVDVCYCPSRYPAQVGTGTHLGKVPTWAVTIAQVGTIKYNSKY